MTKRCVKCRNIKALEEFWVRRSSSDGRHSYCRPCANEYKKNRHNSLLQKLKSVPCQDCGKSYPTYVMDFDHRDPSQKKFEIAHRKTLSEENLLAEIAKCDIVCANCHRIRTHERGYSNAIQGPPAKG